jgi:hypothetical protein
MAKEYQTFVRKYADLTAGERDIFIKDLTPGIYKYNTTKVRAEILTSPQPDSDVLWIRSETGVLNPEPWGVKVLQELPEDTVPGKPWSDVFVGLGWVK